MIEKRFKHIGVQHVRALMAHFIQNVDSAERICARDD